MVGFWDIFKEAPESIQKGLLKQPQLTLKQLALWLTDGGFLPLTVSFKT